MPLPREIIAALDADTLRAAVEGSRSWRQTLLCLGLTASRHVPDLRLLCRSWGIPHEHLGHQAPPDERLREVLATARSWPEAMTRLGYAEHSGTARAAIRRHALRLGIDVRPLAVRPVPAARPLSLAPAARHLRYAGAYLVAAAFVLAGHRILWPQEGAPYDVGVEMHGRLVRVQVKTTTRRVAGTWACSITRHEYADVAGGKRSVCYQAGEFELFAILDGDGDLYVIPFEDVAGITTLSLRNYAAYRVPLLREPLDSASGGAG